MLAAKHSQNLVARYKLLFARDLALLLEYSFVEQWIHCLLKKKALLLITGFLHVLKLQFGPVQVRCVLM